jgi:hypothetical protein
MTLSDLETLPGGRILQAEMGAKTAIHDACASDMLSDVMAHAPDDSVLITIQAHTNTVAVATLAGIRAILVCHDRPVPPEMLEAARREQIAVAVTSAAQYEASWRIHALLAASP